MANKITAIFDLDGKGFDSGLKSLRKSVAEAEGGLNKAKVASQGLWDNLKANAGAVSIAAGAAIVAFGAKAVAAFQETAIEAGKFSDATGLAVEDASRWIEVAGDVGISAETMQGAFVKLNKALATGDLEKYGVELQRTKDGAVDVNATMLNAIKVIGGIKDPTERAEAAQKAFGRSYAEAAEIIFDSADNVQKKLSEVSDAKVIDEQELERARKFRAAMDNLHDSIEDVSIQLGEELVPILQGAADTVDKLTKLLGRGQRGFVDTAASVNDSNEALKYMGLVWDDTTQSFRKAGDVIEQTADQFDVIANNADAAKGAFALAKHEAAALDAEIAKGNPVFSLYADNIKDAEEATKKKAAEDEKAQKAAEQHAEAVEAVAEAMENQRDAALELVGGDIAVRNAQRQAEQAASDLNDTLANQKTTLGEAGAAIDDAAEAQLNAASAAAEYQAQQMEANGQTVDAQTKALLMKEELQKLADKLTGPLKAAILGYIADLDAIPRTVTTNITPSIRNTTRNQDTQQRRGARASGGPTAAGGFYEVNENGSELLTENGHTYLMAAANGNVVPLDSGLPGGGIAHGNGGSTVNVQIDGRTLFRIMWDETERQARNGWRPAPGVRRVMSA